MVEPDEWEIDWSMPAQTVDQMIRAARPDPGAYTGIGDELLVIHHATPTDSGRFGELPPGTPYVRDSRVHIVCGDGALRLNRVRLGRRILNGAEFAELLA